MTTDVTAKLAAIAEQKAEKARDVAEFKHAAELLNNLAREQGIKVLHMPKYKSKGGLTIAYKQHIDGRGKMVDIAVAHCSVADIYSKALGRTIAIDNFVCGMFISLPVGSKNQFATEDSIREMFWHLVN